MLYLIILLKHSAAWYYSDEEITALCIAGYADSNPPSLSPGNATISMINILKPQNYMKKYYNTENFYFSKEDQADYAVDLMPYGFFMYMMIISVVLWLMFISCILCKCCFCLGGPVIKVQTKKQLLCPPLLMGVSLIGIFAFAPFCIYYVSQLQLTINYLICVTARWSGGYYYGYSEWKGIENIDNSTSNLIASINSTANSLNSTLCKYNDNGIYNVSSEILLIFNNFSSDWSQTPYQSNPNYKTYSVELPQYYECSLCKQISSYKSSLSSDLTNLITPISLNITSSITIIYSSLINNLNTLTSTIETRYSWTTNLTKIFTKYDATNMPGFNKLYKMDKGLYSYTLTVFCFTLVVLIFQAFAATMVYFNRYNWRKYLHIGWCCHSFLMIFCNCYLVFGVAGTLFIICIILSEGCVVYDEIFQAEKFGNVFVKSI